MESDDDAFAWNMLGKFGQKIQRTRNLAPIGNRPFCAPKTPLRATLGDCVGWVGRFGWLAVQDASKVFALLPEHTSPRESALGEDY